jgi:hypothetical protein
MKRSHLQGPDRALLARLYQGHAHKDNQTCNAELGERVSDESV